MTSELLLWDIVHVDILQKFTPRQRRAKDIQWYVYMWFYNFPLWLEFACTGVTWNFQYFQ